VTVLIPAYNAATTIKRALDSVFRQDVFRQDMTSIEVLIIDDASTDDTAKIVTGYDRPEIRLLSLPRNVGESSVNAGLIEARGEFVAFLDADDEWLDGKLNKQIAALRANPALSFVTCGCLFVAADGRTLREFGLEPPPFKPEHVWR